jgi:uncharacterized protein (TIGR01777 family)
MRALVTGATGFIGRRLLRELDRPVVLARSPTRAAQVLGPGIKVVAWNADAGPPPPESFHGIDAVFHLAGESVGGGRWNQEKKRRIYDSRVRGTQHLVSALRSSGARPAVLVSASAVGFYGDRKDEIVDESFPPGRDFLAQVCQAWEAEAVQARALGIRTVTPRIGVVLGPGGGALARMLPVFKLGLGGRLGHGRQWMPWVHIDDVAGLLLHAAERAEIDGPMNAVSPEPVTNREFTRTLASVLRRPAIFPVPEFALRLALGEFASVLLASQRVVPRVAERTGYRFRYTVLSEALRNAAGL